MTQAEPKPEPAVTSAPASWDFPRSPAGVRVLVQAGVERGLSVGQCLAGTGLSPEELEDPDGQVEPGQEFHVARNLVRRLGDAPGLGVEAGRRFTLAGMGVFGFALLSSPTWSHALRIAIRYGRLSSAYIRPEVHHPTCLVLHDDELPCDVRDILVERDLAGVAAVLLLIVGRTPPVTIETRLGGARAAALAALLPDGCVIGDRPRHLLVGRPALLATSLAHADEPAWRACERQCAALLERRRACVSLAGRVRSRLLVDPSAIPSMEQVAAELHLDPRTLRRRLGVEGVAFRTLVEDVRGTLAAELLTTTSLTVDEIARRLGFAEAASLAHAFKRWTGESPAAYRERRSG